MEEILPGLLSELAMERHAGPYPATPHAVAPDAKWLNELRALVRASDAGMPVSVVQVAPVTLALMAGAKKLADTLLETYKEGVTARLPTPWLSAMKSSVAALDTFCDLELFAPEVARVKREIAGPGDVRRGIRIAASRDTQRRG